MADLANYATIIIALAMVNIVWQLDRAGRMLVLINEFLSEEDHVTNNE
jgi:hypothetical protein|tara:strand:+ start:1331 stop:1474 length:144 start_codon:yes stop_codon:yes gene_type:complete